MFLSARVRGKEEEEEERKEKGGWIDRNGEVGWREKKKTMQ